MKVACYCVSLARHHIIWPPDRRFLVRSELTTKMEGEVHEDDDVILIVKVRFPPPGCTFVDLFADVGSDVRRRRNWNLITPNMQEGLLGSNWSRRGGLLHPPLWLVFPHLRPTLKPKISAAEGCTRTHCLRNGWREWHERNTPGSTRASDVGHVCLFVEGERGHVRMRAVTDLWEHDCTLLMRCCSTALLICLSLGRNCETLYSTIGFHLIFQKQF